MPLFDKLLEQVKDEDKTVLDKYPQLKETVTNLEAAYADADQRLLGWERWKIDNWDDQAQTTKQAVVLQQRVRELEAAGVSDMTFEEIKAQLQKDGFVATKADLEAALTPKLQGFISSDDHQKALNNLAAGFEQMYAKSANLPLKHQREFNEELDMSALFKYMNETKIFDPEEAHSKMVAARRAEAATAAKAAEDAKHAQEILDAEARGAKAKAEELAMSASGSPTDLGGPAPLMGHLDRLRMAEGDPSKGLPETVQKARLGDMTTAQEAFQEWRKSKLGGTVQ
jgi:hypothetical protein